MSRFQIFESHILIHSHVKPNKKVTQLIAKDENCFMIDLHAQPEDGKANAELILFWSEILHLPKSKIELIRGYKSKQKVIKIPNTSDLIERMNNL